MSCWWNYDIAVYGDRDKLIELEKALRDLTYKTVSGEEATVFQSIRELENHFGFLCIHASRNYGADSPLLELCERFSVLTFAGIFHNDMAPEMHWSFEGRNGELAVQQHVDNDFDETRTVTVDEVKARIKKRADKIARLQQELTLFKDYLVRHHRDQIGDALTEAEAMEIGERIDAEATARPTNTTEAIARLTPLVRRKAREARDCYLTKTTTALAASSCRCRIPFWLDDPMCSHMTAPSSEFSASPRF
jgi:hypothetical protein